MVRETPEEVVWHTGCGVRRVSTPSRARSSLASAAEYVPRRPHDTVLYGIVRKQLATFLAHTERTYTASLPKYVVDAFEHYFALDRIEVLRAGRIAYRLKVPRKGRTHRIMAPMEFMGRLAALIPRPRLRRDLHGRGW
jgi:Putative transposase